MTHLRDKLFYALLEIRMQIMAHTTNHIIIDDKASTTSFLEDVENHLAVAETIKECRRCTHILTEAREEEDVRIKTLKLIHNRTDNLNTLTHFNSCSFLNGHTESMATLRCSEIIHTIGQCQCLRIGVCFIEFLNTTVDIAEFRIYFLDTLTLECHAKVEHTMRRGVLRTNVNHIIFWCKHHIGSFLNRTIGHSIILRCRVRQNLVGHTQRIFLFRFIVLTHRIAFPVFTQKDTAHIGMT